jgi:hypothetical protein
MIVLDYCEGEGVRKVAGNAICLQQLIGWWLW